MPFLIPGHLHDASVGNFPCLTLKAYNSRIWLAYMDACLEDLRARSAIADANLEIDLAWMAVHHMVRWFHIMETSPRRYVSSAQAAGMMEAGKRFLKVSQTLAQYAVDRNLLRWKVLPKHHVPHVPDGNFYRS